MKILAIRLKNLASLAGEQALDFSSGPLQESGLFAITGPTGAGKSTLLDALCLALFGNTPRLRSAPARDSQAPDVGEERLATADPRTLLRRGTASGFAEVDFIGRDGAAYRARWSVRRARNRPEGRLQAAEQALLSLPDERVLASQKREFDRLLPDRLGLTFEQFTRAVMLAQSEFSAFLKADDNARSELLEKLTDTGIYSRISIAAYQRARQANDEIKRLESRLDGELPASAEQRQGMEAEVERTEQAWQAVQTQADSLKARRTWLEQERQLRDSWQDAVTARHQAEQAHAALSKQRVQLARLEVLAPQAHRFRQQRELRQTLTDTHARREATRCALEQAERQRHSDQAAFDKAQQQASQARETRQQAQPLLDEASRHTQRLAYLTQEIEARHHEHQHTERSRQHAQQALAAKSEEQAHCRTELEGLERRLGERTSPEQYRQALQQGEERARKRLMALEEARHTWQHWQQLRQQQDALETRQQRERQAQAELTAKGRHAKARLEQAEQHDRQLRESLERLRAVRSASVEKLRAQLQAQAPCPVCGSLDHPYRRQPPPSPAQELLEQTEREEDRQLAESAHQLEAAHEAHQELTAGYKALRAQLTQREAQLDETARTAAAARQALEVLPVGRELLDQDNAQREDWLNEQLVIARDQRDDQQQALQQFDRDQQRQAPLRETLATLAVEIGKLDSQARQHQQRLAQLDAELTPRIAEQQTLRHTLARQLGEHADVTAWRNALERRVAETEQRLNTARDTLDATRQECQRLSLALEHCDTSQATTHHALETLTTSLQAWREAHPEIDDATLDHLLDMEDAAQAALRQQVHQADQALRDSRLREQERLTTLSDHRRLLLDDARLDDPGACEADINELAETLRREQAELAPRQHQAQQQRDDAQHQLRDDDRRRQALRALQSQLDAAHVEHRRWGRLATLIGSADGKAFRRIAQAYNLERLLEHANVHLTGLSRRYRLVRGGSPLGLLVIDTEMGDEQRSVHSLSGGETFLVSLALALGLASMASGRLRIESLFIDEGFGSLDPQSLALAMDALDGLQAQGRKVGVISHVQEMHERIPVRICVEPTGNGASRLSIVQGSTL